MCMLNGQKCLNNDFTSVSTKGLAVVDNCLVYYNDLNMFDEFNVIRASVMCQNSIREFGVFPSSVPDHSIITWHIDVGYETRPQNVGPTTNYDKFDTRCIPENFLMGVDGLGQINQITGELEGSFRAQSDVDAAYKNKRVYKIRNVEKLNNRKIKIRGGASVK